MPTTVEETCDGLDLAGESCESLGYSAGELACSAACQFDTSGCSVCGSDERIVRCSTLVGTVQPEALALASSGSEVALTWIEALGGNQDRRVRFATWDGADSVVSASECFGPTDARYDVALAAVPSGYLLAVEVGVVAGALRGVEVYKLDAEGAVISGPRFLPDVGSPRLIGRPDQGPLLIYGHTAELLDEDGNVLWTAKPFAGSAYETAAGVLTSESFLLAARVKDTEDSLRVVPLAFDGSIGLESAPVGTSTEYPTIAWSGDEARLSWSVFSGETGRSWSRLGANGQLAGDAIWLADLSGDTEFNPSPMLAFGDETVVLMTGHVGQGSADHLQLVRLGANGAVESGPVSLMFDPNYTTAGAYDMVANGDDVIVAWVGENRYAARQLTLARVRLE